VEGNAVEGPDGGMYNLLRLERGWSTANPIANKAILLRVPPAANSDEYADDHLAPPLEFVAIVDMPGGSCKFTVRRHALSGVYLALTNNVTNPKKCPSARNVLTLVASRDLRSWKIVKTLLVTDEGMAEEDVWRYTAFSYADWQFDHGSIGTDILYALRTSYRGGVSFHNTNRITYKKLTNIEPLLERVLGAM
jgi:hypothetical protein